MSALDDANTALATAVSAQAFDAALLALAVAALDALSFRDEQGREMQAPTCREHAEGFRRALMNATWHWEQQTGIDADVRFR